MKKGVILTSPLPVMSPIIKITGNFCNLKCDYCFYNSRDQNIKTVMDIGLLEKFLREYFELFRGNLRLTWHGGEPLLAGLNFFEKIVDFQKRYAHRHDTILNTLQTNGTLIDEKWAQFFKKNNFYIGVSLDGIEKCHNFFRKDKHGRGSFQHVVRGIQILRAHKVPVSILTTITKYNVQYVEENFRFFAEILGIKNIGNSIFYPDWNNGNKKMMKCGIQPQELTDYFKKAIDFWWRKDDPNFRIREIENYLAGIIGKEASLCLFNGWCSSFFCVEFNGEIYPCDRFSGNKEFLFGDLRTHHLKDILNSRQRLDYAKKANFLHADCMECKWKSCCNNGCLALRNKDGKFYFCETRKAIFDYLARKISDTIERKEGR
jgi:uncharacterized protein